MIPNVGTHEPFCAELTIPFRVSRYLLAGVGLTHLVTALTLLALPVAVVWKLVGLGAIILSCGGYMSLHAGRLPRHSLASVLWREFGGWEVFTQGGEHLPVIFQDSSFCSRWLSVLNFKTRTGRRFVMVLLPDNLDEASGRILRRRVMLAGMKAPVKLVRKKERRRATNTP